MPVLLGLFNKIRNVSLIFQTDDTTVPGRRKMQQTKMLMLISMKDEDDFQTQEFVAELDGGPLYRDKNPSTTSPSTCTENPETHCCAENGEDISI